MQAMFYRRYGGPEVLRLETVAAPTPGPGKEVLVQVHAASLNAADMYLLKGEPALLRLSSGLRGPKRPILGADIAGEVVAVGSQVTQYRPGDQVYGDLSNCGFGGFATYVCAPEHALTLKPARLSFEQAAAVPMAAVTALQGLRAGGAGEAARSAISAGQQVLIHGASGGVGTFAVQLARSFGATVTAVCSTRNVGLARSLGADHVVDYTQEDFTQSDRRYDLILVVNGNRPLTAYRRALSPGGRCVVAGGAIRPILTATLLGPVLWLAWGVSVRGLVAQPSQRQQDLAFVSGLLEAGDVVPVVDRCFPLRELPEALHYHAAGLARGKVVITMEQAVVDQAALHGVLKRVRADTSDVDRQRDARPLES